jgi:hypothetical protein
MRCGKKIEYRFLEEGDLFLFDTKLYQRMAIQKKSYCITDNRIVGFHLTSQVRLLSPQNEPELRSSNTCGKRRPYVSKTNAFGRA